MRRGADEPERKMGMGLLWILILGVPLIVILIALAWFMAAGR
jgi:hypothetical protein